MSISVNRSAAALVLAVALAGGACGAVAGPQPASLDPVVTVHFDDLDTSTSTGSRVLYARISAAAQKVCGTGAAEWYPGERQAQQDCYRATVASTVARLNIPALTALLLEKAQPGAVAAAKTPARVTGVGPKRA